MEYKDLTPEERLVLVALLELIIRADKNYTVEEAAEVERISVALGPGVYKAAVDEARLRLSTLGAVRGPALAVKRPEARELILTAVQDMAVVDEVVEEEIQIVDWLATLWGF